MYDIVCYIHFMQNDIAYDITYNMLHIEKHGLYRDILIIYRCCQVKCLLMSILKERRATLGILGRIIMVMPVFWV